MGSLPEPAGICASIPGAPMGFRPPMASDPASEGRAAAFPTLSKRAARRMIQRAIVLLGRDRHIHQHVREARMVTLWMLEDWKFAWTVEFDRGKVHFERRPAKRPDLTLTWQAAEQFFRQIASGGLAEEGFEVEGEASLRRFLLPIWRAFGKIMSGVLQNPFDDEGNSLA